MKTLKVCINAIRKDLQNGRIAVDITKLLGLYARMDRAIKNPSADVPVRHIRMFVGISLLELQGIYIDKRFCFPRGVSREKGIEELKMLAQKVEQYKPTERDIENANNFAEWLGRQIDAIPVINTTTGDIESLALLAP